MIRQPKIEQYTTLTNVMSAFTNCRTSPTDTEEFYEELALLQKQKTLMQAENTTRHARILLDYLGISLSTERKTVTITPSYREAQILIDLAFGKTNPTVKKYLQRKLQTAKPEQPFTIKLFVPEQPSPEGIRHHRILVPFTYTLASLLYDESYWDYIDSKDLQRAGLASFLAMYYQGTTPGERTSTFIHYLHIHQQRLLEEGLTPPQPLTNEEQEILQRLTLRRSA